MAKKHDKGYADSVRVIAAEYKGCSGDNPQAQGECDGCGMINDMDIYTYAINNQI